MIRRVRADCFAVVADRHVLIYQRDGALTLDGSRVEVVPVHWLARVFLPFTPWLFCVSGAMEGKRAALLIDFSRPRAFRCELTRRAVQVTETKRRML